MQKTKKHSQVQLQTLITGRR